MCEPQKQPATGQPAAPMRIPPPVPPVPLGYQASPAIRGDAICPRCQGPARKVTFTWWGGLVGPKLFHHVKCTNCKYAFNGKTGKSNNTAIAIYTSVAFALVLGAVALKFALT